MSPEPRIVEDDLNIRIILQRLCLAGMKVSLAVRDLGSPFQILAQEAERILVSMPVPELVSWGLAADEKVTLSFEDRSFKYESVVVFKGSAEWEGIRCAGFSVPRVLRRADEFRLAQFTPDTAPKVTFTNSRTALLDGQIKGLGRDGFEMVMQDSTRKIQEVLRVGEESILDLAREDNLRITTHARVAYFGADYVGMQFTERVERTALDQYRNWLDGQERLQAQRDRESFESGGGRQAQKDAQGVALPQVRVWVDRDPAILILTEREDFARRMAEGLGRKFGILSLDYIKGSLKSFLLPQEGAEGWGKARMIVIHNHLRLVSPLELSRQVVEHEKCPLPVLLAGTDEDVDLKRNRAMAAGAVDYVPVEPFRILSVLRKLDETLKLFDGC
jgi:CheY-like chemotaxis protein